MVVASIRVSIQWPPAEEYENTETLVLLSNEQHFVDIRFRDDIDRIDWILTGKEYDIPNTNKIEFQHEINTNVPGFHGGEFDVGNFNSIPNTDDREETGEMMNPQTRKVQPYREVWRSIDPLKSTFENFVREDSNSDVKVPCVVLKVVQKPGVNYIGTVVRLGNFLQGALLNKDTETYNCAQYYLEDGKWEHHLDATEVGKDGSDDDIVPSIPFEINENLIELDGVEWEVVESNL